jgi:hypothetical protein
VKPGTKCKGGAACVDGASALWCINGSFQRISCSGPKGCRAEHNETTCLQTIGDVGEACVEGPACSTDGHALLNCVDHRFVGKFKCRGRRGCYQVASEVRCDMTESEPGDPCRSPVGACSTDHASLLLCREGALVVSLACRGPKGCYEQDKEVWCDGGVGVSGDPCENGSACTADGTTFLKCVGGKLEPTPCRGERGCHMSESKVYCDESRATEGDPCDSVKESCSMDGKHLLGCVDHRRAVIRRCSHGCTVSPERDRMICK